MRTQQQVFARKEYMSIIAFAKSQSSQRQLLKKNGEYFERHHILPKCIYPLWIRNPSNLVLLTASEHFKAHQLLTQIYDSNKIRYAFTAMFMKGDKHISTPEEYEACRKMYIDIVKNRTEEEKQEIYHKWKLSHEKRTIDQKLESIEKMRKTISGWPPDKKKERENKRKNFYNNFSESQKKEYSEKMSNSLKNMDPKKKELKRKKCQQAMVGRHYWNNGKENFFGFEKPIGDEWVEGKLSFKVSNTQKEYYILIKKAWDNYKNSTPIDQRMSYNDFQKFFKENK